MQQNSLTPEQQFFRDIPQFSILGDEQIADLAKSTSKRKYKAGEHVFYQGDRVQELYFLEMGRVEISKSDINGKKLTLWHIEEKDIFCLANLFTPAAFASAIAVENSMVYVLPKKTFEEIIMGSGDLSRNLICCICGKLATYSSLVDDFAFKKIEVRLAKTLVRNSSPAGDHEYCCTLSQEELAAMVGTSREVVGRCLKLFRERGILEVSKIGRPRHITVIDLPALEHIVAEDS